MLQKSIGMTTRRPYNQLTKRELPHLNSDKVSTETDLLKMATDILDGNWEGGSAWYYEDPNDPQMNILCHFVDSFSEELEVIKNGISFEMLSCNLFTRPKLMTFILDTLASTDEEIRELKYDGHYTRLKGTYYAGYVPFTQT